MRKELKNILLSVIAGLICIPLTYFASKIPGQIEHSKLEKFLGDITMESSPLYIYTVGHTSKQIAGVKNVTSIETTKALSNIYNFLGQIGKTNNIYLSIDVNGTAFPKYNINIPENVIVVGGANYGWNLLRKHSNDFIKSANIKKNGNVYWYWETKDAEIIGKNKLTFFIYKVSIANNKHFIFLNSLYASGAERAVSFFSDNYKTLMDSYKDKSFLLIYEYHSSSPDIKMLLNKTFP